MNTMHKWIAIGLLVFSIGFNLWLYRLEPTAQIDPNDNAFQYALVDRTNQIWDWTNINCSNSFQISNFKLKIFCQMSYLTDHWVPNWAQGYNLPYYYSHIPQIIIVGSYRLFTAVSKFSIFNFQFLLNFSNFKFQISNSFTLFQYYHIIIYLLLCFFPLSMFLAFRILKLPWLTAGIAALLASQISTDGLYGIDQSSFLWRGWGLSSQLFALIWLPLAIASIMRYVVNSNSKSTPPAGGSNFKLLFLSIFFLTATTAGHLGIGMMAFLAIPVLCLNKHISVTIKQTFLLAVPPLILLSYWIIPAFLNNNYHNISIWDPVWKFNSFGVKDVLAKFINGELFDFGRFPIFTILVFVGIFITLYSRLSLDSNDGVNTGKKNACSSSSPFYTVCIQQVSIAMLFLFYLILFFGRTTWGGLLNLIPGMSEFHQHRFLVGVHLAGLFLAPIGLTWMINTIYNLQFTIYNKFFKFQISNFKLLFQISNWVFIILLLYISLFPQTISYAQYNTTLIKQANDQYQKAKPDADILFSTLSAAQKIYPGRVYALRAKEGSDFKITSSAYYMYLSTYGVPTVLWLPETWSMNSDTEQFFIEEDPSHYALYNIRYVVAPPSKIPQTFWKLIKETASWKLYAVETDGYITVGTAPSVVSGKKTDIINLIHLWIQSSYPKQQIYPELRFNEVTNKRSNEVFPSFSMLDPVTYRTPDGATHSLFEEVPSYSSESSDSVKITSQSSDSDMIFSARVEITAPCPTCVIVLKQTYHPNWKATVNGKRAQTIIVFPFFTAVRLEEPGTYEVIFSYTPKFSTH